MKTSNGMKKYILFSMVISAGLWFLNPDPAWAACIGSSPTWTSTPDYESVNTCVSLASPEDTINISAGSQTWNSTLSINKGINLIGAGIGNTIISGSAIPLISYAPSSSNATYNYAFRVSGFTFNLPGSGQAIFLSSGNSTTLQTKVRIDHNRFYNSNPSQQYSGAGAAVENEGMRGVIDQNQVEDIWLPMQVGWGDKGTGDFWWDNFPELNYGTSENMYVEDNTFTGVTGALEDGDTGGRYAFRYNDITPGGDMFPLFDMHGPQSGAGRSGFGVEIYGNKIIGNVGMDLFNQRGARALVFYNKETTSVGWYVQFEVDGNWVHSSGECINNSYYWINRNSAGTLPTSWEYTRPPGGYNCSLSQNGNYWLDNTSCEAPNTCSNITTGVGCGTLANRPTSCTTGTGYWATNQSCSNLSGMVGVNPATPISGTLYKCTSTNTWTAYYTPYTYPHPLRNEGGEVDTTPPVISDPLPSGTLVCDTNPLFLTLQVMTNENATCKRDMADVPYDSMSTYFSTTGGTSHSGPTIDLACGTSQIRYVRCVDGAGNKNQESALIIFTIASESDTTPPAAPTGVVVI